MANDAPDNTRIQHFSNPDVLFAGQATGIDGTRNNAAQIRGAFCEVANNNTPVIFSAHFEHEPSSTSVPDGFVTFQLFK